MLYRSLLFYLDKASLTEEGSDLKITFKVRKVNIERPWLNPDILKHSNLGIKSFKRGEWSTGSLDPKENPGTFPLLPTACIVVKNIKVSAVAFSANFEERIQRDSAAVSKIWTLNTNSKISRLNQIEIGPFAVGGTHNNFLGCTKTRHHYNKESKTLEVDGAQIIGWICTVIPEFPKAEVW